jgi:hypothetical protein
MIGLIAKLANAVEASKREAHDRDQNKRNENLRSADLPIIRNVRYKLPLNEVSVTRDVLK